MCIVLYILICQVWCSGIQGIYARLQVGQSAIGICALFYIYIYIYIYRSVKFSVVVFQASMLNWPGGQSAMGMCALSIYIYIYIYI